MKTVCFSQNAKLIKENLYTSHIRLLKINSVRINKIFLQIAFPCALLLFIACKKSETTIATQVETISADPKATSISLKGKIIVLSDADRSEYGFCCSTQPNPTVTNEKVTFRDATVGEYTGSIEGLTLGLEYYVRAYCKEGITFVYGESLKATTTLTLPAITTTAISDITSTTFLCGGNVTDDGGTTITERGVYYSNKQNPTTANSKVVTEGATGSFTCSIVGLSENNLYYVRAYASNSVGTVYGNEVTNSELSIGQSYKGGIIAYIFPGSSSINQHGLIAAPGDQSSGIQWYNGDYVTTGATKTSLGTGNENTNAIVSIQGEGNYAAKLCYDLVLGEYSDWYLPSKDELNLLFLNREEIGGFAGKSYWSSSEASRLDTWLLNFINGAQASSNLKKLNYRVRAIRTF